MHVLFKMLGSAAHLHSLDVAKSIVPIQILQMVVAESRIAACLCTQLVLEALDSVGLATCSEASMLQHFWAEITIEMFGTSEAPSCIC